MSGGSYNYAYTQIDELADAIMVGNPSLPSSVLRRQFKQHLQLVAKACRAIEWNDSGDGDSREEELIRACLNPKKEE